MKIRVLGSSGAEFPGYNPPAFLVDSRILLDGGTIGSKLSEAEQWKIRDILVTHSHLDHIKGIPFLADNIIIKNKRHSITIYGIRETLKSLRDNLLNDKIWPDFTKISAAIDPVIKLRNISPGRSFSLNGYDISAYRVNHTVPAVGYVVRDNKGSVLLYTGDTGPTDDIWKTKEQPSCIIAEVSFPNSMEGLSVKTGHLTANLLERELKKVRVLPDRVLITHPKPQYMKQIKSEIRKIKGVRAEMLEDDKVYEI